MATGHYEGPYDPPADFPPDDSPGFNEWREVPDPFGDGLVPGGQVPLIMVAKFNSSSRQAEILIHDPVNALKGTDHSITLSVDSQVTAILDDPALRISTFVVNHERTLARRIIRAKAVLDEDGTSVGLTLHKQESEAKDS
jgi:hypothetical protein